MTQFTTLIMEAIIVGILITALYNLLNADKYLHGNMKHFIVGFIAHIIFEIFGLNAYYCKTKLT